MADFDLSLVASFDTKQAETGGAQLEKSIDGVTNAEKRSEEQARRSKKALDDAAKAERDRKAAIDAVRSAIEPGYAAQQRMNALLADATRLHREGAISLNQLAQVEKLHANALKGGAQSAGQARSAYTQLGFQIQDITQTLAMGVNPMVVFGQQAGQTAAAVAGMGGKLGAVGTFLSGPWGSLILGAVTVTGLLATSLFNAGNEAEKKEKKVRALNEVLADEKASIEEVIEALEEYNRAQGKAQETDLEGIRTRALAIQSHLDEARALREKLAAQLEFFQAESRRGATSEADERRRESAFRLADETAAAIATNESKLRTLETSARNVTVEAATAIADIQSDREKALRTGFDVLRDRLKDSKLGVEELTQKLADLNRQEQAALETLRKSESARTNRVAGASASAQASVGDMVALIKELFPGAQITSTTGGRHKRGSDHYAGRAIDFVPGGGMGQYSTSQVESILKGAGVDIRRNKSGVQQLFGPGRGAERPGDHDDHFHLAWQGMAPDVDKVREAVEKAQQALEEFGTRSGEAIKRVSERFDEQPKLIDSAAQAARQLDEIIADLAERKPPGFEELIADAQAAKGVIADALLRPFDELLEASERRMQIDRLIASGREDEARALQTIWQLEEKLGPLSRERRQQILDMVVAEREMTEELERRQELTDAYLDATRSVRREVEAILSGTGKLSNLKGIFQQLKGRVLAEQLFGDVFRDLEKYVKQETGIKDSVDILKSETERAGEAAGNLATTFDDVVRSLRASAAGETLASNPADWQGFLDAFDAEFGKPEEATPGAPAGDEIIATAIKGGVSGMTPERYFEEMTKRLVKPLLDGFDAIFGTEFFGKLEGVFSGAVNGYLTGGVPGGILGALKGIKGLPKGVEDALGKGLKGAQTGTMTAGVMKALGIKSSTTGAQIGGAIGSFLPIPGGQIIGSIAGGLLGGLFKKTPKASASFTGVDSFSTSSRGKGMAESIGGLAGAFQSSLQNIAQALDAELGAFSVSIGQRKDEIRVIGRSGVDAGAKKVSGALYKGTDADAAIAAAVRDAIADGAVQGLSDAVRRALNSSSDIDKAVAEAVKVKNLEAQLKTVGDAFAATFDDFRKVAAERVELAKKYGLDLLKVEELNARERKELIDEALERSVGSLKRLVDDLNFGNLFEGTASERRQRLLGEVADAKEDVAAGVTGATDRLAELERQLVETSRAAFGTAGGEYAADRAQALTTAQSIIEAETKRIEDAAAMQQAQVDLANETNDLLSGVNGRLDSILAQLGRGALPAAGGGGDIFGGLGAWSGIRDVAVAF